MEMLNRYISSARLYKTKNFLFVIIGYVLGGGVFSNAHVLKLVGFYFVFSILIYGGLYALNYISESNPKFKDYELTKISAISIMIGIAITTLVYPNLLLLTLLVVAINLAYSFLIKQSSLVLGILLIASTGSLKLLAGLILANAHYSVFYVLLVCHYLASVIFHGLRNSAKGNLPKTNLYIITLVATFILFSLLITNVGVSRLVAGLYLLFSISCFLTFLGFGKTNFLNKFVFQIDINKQGRLRVPARSNINKDD